MNNGKGLTRLYPMVQIDKGTWEIDEFDIASMFLLEGEERAMLIDTGMGVGDLRGAVEMITDKPLVVVHTHGHIDHTGNARQFDEIWLHPADRRRIVRAIEIYELTGKTITQHDRETRLLPPRYRAEKLCLSFRDRERLYERIDRRVDRMVAQGLFDEVEALLREGLSPDCTAMQAIGYKEAALALRGELSRQEAADLIKQSSRRYAKRQLTWFKRDPQARWFLWDREPDIDGAVEAIVKNEE